MSNTDSLPPLPPIEDPRHPEGRLIEVPDESEAAPEPVPEETYTLARLAQMEGQKAKPAPDAGEYFWKHNVAAFLHGWNVHEYHTQSLVRLSLTDYREALRAATEEGKTHPPAVRN